MKVFLDTNILLDLLLEREEFEASAQILDMANNGKFKLFVSALTMVNVAYVYQKTVGRHIVIPNIKVLTSVMEVLPIDNGCIQKALYLEGNDYEDVLQAVCAANAGCDCIITRNAKDYKIKPGLSNGLALPKVYTPAEFLINNPVESYTPDYDKKRG